MSLPPAILLQDSSTFISNNHFFKSLPKIQFEKEEDWESPAGSPLLPVTIHSLCIVDSVSCALLLDQNVKGHVLLLPIEPLIQGQHISSKEEKEFGVQIKNKIIKIKNKWICNTLIPPGQILISPDELYFAVEVFRGDQGHQDVLHFLLIYDTIDFIKNKDESVPLIEVRLSTNLSNNVQPSLLSWNPVPSSEEKKNERIISIYCPADGNLILLQVKGRNEIEILNSRTFINPWIISMCWSPKGKQLACGLTDGSLRQLKMNLSDAKIIPSPPRENNNDIYYPKSLLWVSTLQFFILYEVNSSYLDFMILDLPKGSPPTFYSYGDIFTSDLVQGNSYCKFIQQPSWDTVLCISNTGNDIVLLKKLMDNNVEKWNIVEFLEDRCRPTLPIDNYLIGASLFKGYYGQQIIFSECEMYENVPVLIVISQSGLLISYFFINNEPNMSKICLTSPSPCQSVISQLSQFHQQQKQQQMIKNEEVVARDPRIKPQNEMSNPLLFQQQENENQTFINFKMPEISGTKDQNQNISSPMFYNLLMNQVDKPAQYQHQQQRQCTGTTKITQQQQQSFYPSLTNQQNPQIQPQVIEKAKIESEIETVNLKLEKFKEKREIQFKEMNERISLLLNKFDQELMPSISEVTTFVEDMTEVTNRQTDKVAILKKNHLIQYKYLQEQKTLLEQKNDPNYLRLKKAQPIPPDLHQKLTKIQEQFRVITKQVNESCKSLYYDKLNKESPLTEEQTLEMIIKTVVNHSKIIQHLSEELARVQTAYQNKFGYIPSINDSFPAHLKTNEETYDYDGGDEEKDKLFESLCTDENDEINVDELISGVTLIKLNRPSIYPHKQPVIMTRGQVDVIRNLGKNKKVVKITSNGPAVLNLAPHENSSNGNDGENKTEGSEYDIFLTKERDIIRKSLTPISIQKTVRTIPSFPTVSSSIFEKISPLKIIQKSPIIDERPSVSDLQQKDQTFQEKEKVTFGQVQPEISDKSSILKSHLITNKSLIKQPQTQTEVLQQQTPTKEKTVGFATPVSSSIPISTFPIVSFSSSIFEKISLPTTTGTTPSSNGTGIQPKYIFGNQINDTSKTILANEKPHFGLGNSNSSLKFGNENITIPISKSEDDKTKMSTKTTLASVVVSPFASTIEKTSIFGTTNTLSSSILPANQSEPSSKQQISSGKQEISQNLSNNFDLGESKTTTTTVGTRTAFAAAIASSFSATTTEGTSIFGPSSSPTDDTNQNQSENLEQKGQENESQKLGGGSFSFFGNGSSGDSPFSTTGTGTTITTTTALSPFSFTPPAATDTDTPSFFGSLKINSNAFGQPVDPLASFANLGGQQQQQQQSSFGASPSNIFGSPATPAIGQPGFGQPSAFGSFSSSQQSSTIGGGNVFGNSSIFGASQSQQQTSNLFGGGESPFSSSTSTTTSAASTFSFSPTVTTSSSFGNSSIFGTFTISPLATPAFGTPPVFGGGPSGAPNNGQTAFGQTASQNIFGGGQPASFGSFGELAQPQQQQQQGPTPSFGGALSFSSWR